MIAQFTDWSMLCIELNRKLFMLKESQTVSVFVWNGPNIAFFLSQNLYQIGLITFMALLLCGYGSSEGKSIRPNDTDL